jgi:hypothetical protein
MRGEYNRITIVLRFRNRLARCGERKEDRMAAQEVQLSGFAGVTVPD